MDTQWLILNLESASGDHDVNGNSSSRTPIQSSPSRISSSNSSVGDQQQPTLRLKLRLEGPYRPEVSAVINLANSWFGAVDVISDTTVGAATGVIGEVKNFRLPSYCWYPLFH